MVVGEVLLPSSWREAYGVWHERADRNQWRRLSCRGLNEVAAANDAMMADNYLLR